MRHTVNIILAVGVAFRITAGNFKVRFTAIFTTLCGHKIRSIDYTLVVLERLDQVNMYHVLNFVVTHKRAHCKKSATGIYGV